MITTQSDLSLNSNKIISKHLTIGMQKILNTMYVYLVPHFLNVACYF